MKLTDLITTDHTISCVAFKANTSHGPSWSGRENLALSIGNTRPDGGTRVHTPISVALYVTDFKCWAIYINFAVLLLNNRFGYC